MKLLLSNYLFLLLIVSLFFTISPAKSQIIISEKMSGPLEFPNNNPAKIKIYSDFATSDLFPQDDQQLRIDPFDGDFNGIGQLEAPIGNGLFVILFLSLIFIFLIWKKQMHFILNQKKIKLLLLCFFIIGSLSASTPTVVNTSCGNFKLKFLSSTESTCMKNGTLVVQFVNADNNQPITSFSASGLSNLQFRTKSSVSPVFDDWSTEVFDPSKNFATITNLSAGQYEIEAQFQCNTGGGSVSELACSDLPSVCKVPGTYKNVNPIVSNTYPTLNCKPTGIIEFKISDGKGPYKAELMDIDNGNTIIQTLTNLDKDVVNRFTNLASSHYSIKVTDDCNSSSIFPPTSAPAFIEKLYYTNSSNIKIYSDFPENPIGTVPILSKDIIKNTTSNGGCKAIYLPAISNGSSLGSNQYSFWNGNDFRHDFYEYQISSSPTYPTSGTWSNVDPGVKHAYALTQSYADARFNGEKVYFHFRIKGSGSTESACSTKSETLPLAAISSENIPVMSCTDPTTSFTHTISTIFPQHGVVCYPYTLEVFEEDPTRSVASKLKFTLAGIGEGTVVTVPDLTEGKSYYIKVTDASGAVNVNPGTTNVWAPSEQVKLDPVHAPNGYTPIFITSYYSVCKDKFGWGTITIRYATKGSIVEVTKTPVGGEFMKKGPIVIATGGLEYNLLDGKEWVPNDLNKIENFQELPEGDYEVKVKWGDCDTNPKTLKLNYKRATMTHSEVITSECKGKKIAFDMNITPPTGATAPTIYYFFTSNPANLHIQNELDENAIFILNHKFGWIQEEGTYSFTPRIASSGCAVTDPIVITHKREKFAIDTDRSFGLYCELNGSGQIVVIPDNPWGPFNFVLKESPTGPVLATINGADKAIFDNQSLIDGGSGHTWIRGNTYYIQITNACGLQIQPSIDLKDISIGLNINVKSDKATYCSGDDIIIEATNFYSAKLNYTLTFPDGTTIMTSPTGHFLIPSNHAALQTGTYKVSIEERPVGCYDGKWGTTNITVVPAFNKMSAPLVCEEDPFTLTVTPLSGLISNYTYQWEKNGTILGSATSNTITNSCCSLTDAGKYVTIVNNSCRVDSVTFAITPNLSTWTGAAGNSNWNDAGNWDRGIPGKCTNVHIYKDKPFYPELAGYDPATNVFLCDTIHFHPGGEVAKTPFLDYEAAKVELEVGVNRWYSMAAPLREMYFGDYLLNESLGRKNPVVYSMLYQMKNPENGDPNGIDQPGSIYNGKLGYWSFPFNTLDYNNGPGVGSLIWINPDNDPAGAKTAYTFAFPKDSLGYFYYDKKTGAKLPGNYAVTNRNSYLNPNADIYGNTPARQNRRIGHRFIYEDPAYGGTYVDPHHNTAVGATFSYEMPIHNMANSAAVLITNPFMSELDFSVLYSKNSSKFQNKFSMVGASGAQDYFTYNPNDGSLMTTNYTNPVSEHLIPPMQSFIVEKLSSGLTFGSISISDDMSVTKPNGGLLRTSDSSQNLFNLEILNSKGDRQSAISVIYNEEKDQEVNMATVFNTAISFDNSGKEIFYSPASVLFVEQNEKAMSIFSIHDLNQQINLGIHTETKGQLTLKLKYVSGVFDKEGSKITLFDKKTGNKVDLTTSNSYSFENNGENSMNRFYLKASGSYTGIESVNNTISIYAANNRISVFSQSGDPIQNIEIVNMQGQIIHNNNLNSSLYEYQVGIGNLNQMVVVKVKTRTNQMVKKVLIKN